jgi:hypothetical protein
MGCQSVLMSIARDGVTSMHAKLHAVIIGHLWFHEPQLRSSLTRTRTRAVLPIGCIVLATIDVILCKDT